MSYQVVNTSNWKDKNTEKISFVGKIEEVGEGYFVIFDSLGTVNIKNENNFKVSEGEIVRVFCRKEEEPVAEFIQPLSGLDLELFEKATSIFMTV